MAVTKIHPIKSTLKLAIEYILNPEKTDEKILASSFGCGFETADMEFKFTRELAKRKSPNLAHHLTQSFEPGETTPEEAHEIGMRLAEEVLGGKYEFVLTTHIDKGHIHNHIIYNSVSFTDYNHYHSTPPKYYNIRRTSDKLCEEYGLSVIRNIKGKGKSYIEYTAAKQGKSWKAQLKNTIDTLIPLSKDFDDFLLLMEQQGYNVKRQNKNVSFCSAGRERYMRSKTLGPDYTVEALKERIAGKIKRKHISLIIDIQNCIKAQESKGYEHWAKINNLKQAAKTLNFLTENDITTYDELEKVSLEKQKEFDSISEKVKELESRINTTAMLIKNVETYSKLKPVMEQRKKASDKGAFDEKHRAEIILFEAALRELKGAKYPPINKLRQTYKILQSEKEPLYNAYKKAKAEATEIDIIKSNVDSLLGTSHRQSRDISAFLE